MLRYLILVLSFLTLFSLSHAKNSYFPNAPDLTWTYSNGEERRMTGPYQYEGLPVMVVTRYLNDTLIFDDYFVYTEEGVFTIGVAVAGGELQLFDPPLIVYEGSQLSPGQFWESTTVYREQEIKVRTEVVGLQGVKTEAGRFNALLLRERTLTATGAQTEMDMYFVPSVGIVRFSTSDGDVIDLVDKNF